MKKGYSRFLKRPVAVGVATALLALTTHQQAQAVTFSFGELEGSFDSTWTAGASWRTEDRDFDLIGKANQPEFNNSQNNWLGYDGSLNPIFDEAAVWDARGAYSTNGDNGNLAWDSGETFSKIFKGLHELDVRYRDYGLFVRGMYFYDFELMDESTAWSDPVTGKQYDPCRDDDAKDNLCRDIRLLDAYVSADWYFGEYDDISLSVRVGQQVINWGESTFISHGLSEIVPVDIARLRAPGSELREAFIPFGAVWASLGLTENLTIEAFYQYDWEESVLPPPGSYFSTNDFAGDGGDYATIQLGFAKNPDLSLDAMLDRINGVDALTQAQTGLTLAQLMEAAAAGDPAAQAGLQQIAGYYLSTGVEQGIMAGDFHPDDDGQYGLKLSYFAPELNDTEFGLYYVNYHSRRPLLSGEASNFCTGPTTDACAQVSPGVTEDLAYLAAGNAVDRDSVKDLQMLAKAYKIYPEDIEMFGFSFNTSIGDTSLSGEISHRLDEPLQKDDIELLFAAMPEQLALAGLGDAGGISQIEPPLPGGWVDGIFESDTTQWQFTAAHLFGPSLGADNFVMLGEVGFVYIHDMPDEDELRLNGPGTDRSGGFPTGQGREASIQDGVESNPFPDDFAWGYRLLAKLDYNNVFGGVNMSPRVVFSHDVEGITPDPMFLFVEERKSANVTLSFDYLQRWTADFSYNVFWDGKGTTNRLEDRDFVSFNIKYSI